LGIFCCKEEAITVGWRKLHLPYKILVGKPEFRSPLGRPSHIREDIIKMSARELDLEKDFESFMAAMFQVEFFCFVTPCSIVIGYRRFRGQCCLHLQDEVDF